MKITKLRVNHIKNPVGYDFSKLHFGWNVIEAEGSYTKYAIIRIYEIDNYSSDEKEFFSKEVSNSETAGCCDVNLSLKPYTKYAWYVEITSDKLEICTSDKAFFETAKINETWTGKWIVADTQEQSVNFLKEFSTSEKKSNDSISRATLYICGFGLYEAYINGEKVSNEYLMPGYHSYDLVNEYQTYDVTQNLVIGSNHICIYLGNGWYKGRFVFEGGQENIYGDNLKTIAELHIWYKNGMHEVISTDDSWICETTEILSNNIYDGENQDYRNAGNIITTKKVEDRHELLAERSSMPLVEIERIKPREVITTPKGETVLDFGETITGWVTFQNNECKDQKVILQYGEWMIDGNFYKDNLRTAKAEFSYVSDGMNQWVRPEFTFFGFRYVKLTGFRKVNKDDFIAVRLRSACEKNGDISTGNDMINRLIANAYASQQCNFLDIPTDCPQRDERMGWTGDIALFADTACFNMDSAGFLSHYMKQLRLEQVKKNGQVPMFVPVPKIDISDKKLNPFFVVPAVAVWGDAGVIIPWTLYEHYHDKGLLEDHYPAMKDWVNYEKSRAMDNPIPYLWQNDMQLADWLALDSTDSAGLFGATDAGLVASAFYYHSTELLVKAARELGYKTDEEQFQMDADMIKEAFQRTFFDRRGNLTVKETQTSYALTLEYGLYPEKYQSTAVTRLDRMIEESNGHLQTGFVGTAMLCPALSNNGYHERACELLLNEKYPGWLYEVKLGGVTIWERWNSVNPDGTMNADGMNSLNHYAYGSIIGWVYRTLLGFNPCTEQKNTMLISPHYCRELHFINGKYQAPWGIYEMEWQERPDGIVEGKLLVPFDGQAILKIGKETKKLSAGTYEFTI